MANDPKIDRRDDVNPTEGEHKYGTVDFADRTNKKYPIDTPEHVRAAWNDARDISTSHGKKLDAHLSEAHIPHDIKFYEGAKHSFMNDSGPTHNPDAATDAWDRVLAFSREYL